MAIYMKVEGDGGDYSGETVTKDFPKMTLIDNVQWGFERKAAESHAKMLTGTSQGQVQQKQVEFSGNLDKAQGPIFQAAAQNKSFKKVSFIFIIDTEGKTTKRMGLVFETCFLEDMQLTLNADGGVTYTGKFSYLKYTQYYQALKPDGGKDGGMTPKGFDFAARDPQYAATEPS
jgi:type VI protein secretion system component Hcp